MPKVNITEHAKAICKACEVDWDRVSRMEITTDEITIEDYARQVEGTVQPIRRSQTFRLEWDRVGEGRN